ncbi:MAG: hypothetical protein P4L44_12895 [Oryzomonas sp.]|uniref:hypothetical protein n=1 Tax=Oryzomonas sp. TaxID=2855186 RepID=UPI002840BA09|nr:hypothetical protein [Oryzomonas sp.]MDR3580851.1 hypothetical protein [Oryzomonas sp.]
MKLLLHGFDSVYCAYFLKPTGRNPLDFGKLAEQQESIRQSKRKNSLPITLGNADFLLTPYGTKSGYPFVIMNGDFNIQLGEYNKPNFYVQFYSQALWRESGYLLHEKFLDWAASVGLTPYRPESLSRVDYCFDYDLPEIDFDEDCFKSLSVKDSKHRGNRKDQTFTFGNGGDIMLRVYDKVAEIKQKSDKVWFYTLWGQDADVWRIEYQVRKEVLKDFSIATFDDLKAQIGDLLRYLATDHTSLRQPNGDSNSSRWPLHPLWIDLLERIGELNHLGVSRIHGQNSVLEERMVRMTIAIYGYLKKVAAVHCVQTDKPLIDVNEALGVIDSRIQELHVPLAWQADVEKRIKEIRLGQW